MDFGKQKHPFQVDDSIIINLRNLRRNACHLANDQYILWDILDPFSL
jgi:hypothetical protein